VTGGWLGPASQHGDAVGLSGQPARPLKGTKQIQVVFVFGTRCDGSWMVPFFFFLERDDPIWPYLFTV
jgi:hypothetical protein